MAEKKKTEFDGSTEYTDIVRFPLKLFVDAIVFEPSASIDVVRSSYELHLTPYEMKKFHDWLKEKIEKEPYTDQTVTIIGRLVS